MANKKKKNCDRVELYPVNEKKRAQFLAESEARSAKRRLHRHYNTLENICFVNALVAMALLFAYELTHIDILAGAGAYAFIVGSFAWINLYIKDCRE